MEGGLGILLIFPLPFFFLLGQRGENLERWTGNGVDVEGKGL